MKRGQFYGVVIAGLCLAFGLSCVSAHAKQATETYIAKLAPLNAKATGHNARGEARFTISGNTLTITLNAHGLPPGMMHMVHLHGFADGKNAVCPGPGADVNHDGVIDLNETEPAAGVTMVPLNGDPAALEIATNTYPVASKSGRISYRQTVRLSDLNQKMAAAFKGASLDLGRRVIFIHGVPPDAKLPKTAASLPGVPAQATIPIACGKITRVK